MAVVVESTPPCSLVNGGSKPCPLAITADNGGVPVAPETVLKRVTTYKAKRERERRGGGGRGGCHTYSPGLLTAVVTGGLTTALNLEVT